MVRHLPEKGEAERDTILVGVDGSPESFGALMTAIDLAKRLGKKIELVSVYDPYLHYAVFKGIVEVLTEKAAKVFRFEEQNQLHEEIIDTGLAEIYQSHLNVAEKMAREEGVEASKTLLDGKAFQKVLDHARKIEPFLLVIGRVGVHSSEKDGGLGSNTENLLRKAPCDVLLTTAKVTPELDLKAEESIHWTPEAEERMTRVPEQVSGIARTAILRLAIEQGHSVVTSDLVTEAMERFMPKASQRATTQLAEALAYSKAGREAAAACKKCGTVARVPDPEKCATCGATEFEVLTPEMLDKIAEAEGGAEEETTYDGRKLRWTNESRKALRTLGDNYQRRRAKARIEKAARRNRLDTISLEFARRFVEEEAGVLYRPAEGDEGMSAADKRRSEEAQTTEAEQAVDSAEDSGMKILARDRKNNPLLSRRDWTEKAIERVLRVPAGFMRDRTQARVEELAEERGADKVDLALVEAGIEVGLEMMKEMVATYGGGSPEMASHDAKAADSTQETKANGTTVEQAQKCPAAAEHEAQAAEGNGHSNGNGHRKQALNEVSVLSEMDKRRQELDA
ncbi:MAG: universal stress protein [Thermoanaerobaculia bacterium]